MRFIGSLLIVFILNSCSNNSVSKTANTKKLVEVDYFKISDAAFSKFKSSNYAQYFIDKKSKTKLFLLPYTDYSITTAILTIEDSIPNYYLGLLKFEGIIPNSPKPPITIQHIESEKGIKIGLSLKDLSQRFGTPDSSNKGGMISNFIWNQKIKSNKENNVGHLEPFQLSGLGIEIHAKFYQDSLVSIIYNYEVP